MKKLLLLSIALTIFVNCSKHPSKRKINKNFKRHTTLILGVENRGNLVRGWNDLTMLLIEEKDVVKVVSIPRDTLVWIPPKGYWTLNSLYLVLNIEGTVNHFNHNFENIKIDDYIVYNINDMFDLAEKINKIPGLPKKYKNILKDYKYINDWVRHRHKLKVEIDRQRRIHAFIDYMINMVKDHPLPIPVISFIETLINGVAEKTSFDKSHKKLRNVYYSILCKPIKYYMWDGTHREVFFNLKNEYTGHVFQYGYKWIYSLDHNDVDQLKPYENCYKFSKENFFEMVGKKIPIKSQTGLYKNCTTWYGGLLLNYKRLIRDKEFTNQNWIDADVHKFIKSYPQNKLSKKEIDYLISECRRYKINIWLAIAQMEKESSLIKNRSSYDYIWRKNSALGYGCKTIGTNKNGQRYHANWGYEKQVHLGIWCLRKWFDDYEKDKTIRLYSYEGEINPKNASTYALYRYTPFYGEAVSYGHFTIGNRRFKIIWNNFKRRRKELLQKKKVTIQKNI